MTKSEIKNQILSILTNLEGITMDEATREIFNGVLNYSSPSMMNRVGVTKQNLIDLLQFIEEIVVPRVLKQGQYALNF